MLDDGAGYHIFVEWRLRGGGRLGDERFESVVLTASAARSECGTVTSDMHNDGAVPIFRLRVLILGDRCKSRVTRLSRYQPSPTESLLKRSSRYERSPLTDYEELVVRLSMRFAHSCRPVERT